MLKLLFIFLFLKAVNLTDVTYYEILGITKQASTQEIRQAYKKLAIKFHPDKNSDEVDQEKFLKITEAYETLKDPEKRQKYDRFGNYPTYGHKYDYRSQSEYNNLFYNGLYHDDPYVDTISGGNFYDYLKDGFYFINFYSPFCPPCQNLADQWKKLAEIYKGIVKIGAVNCKYHNSFCYNSMRIGSYPSLLFYPNGYKGSYVYYRGDHNLEALDQFVMKFIRNSVHIPTVSQVKSTNTPIAYVQGANRIDRDALMRIAYQLNNLVTIVIVEDDSVRSKLSNDDYTTVVFKYKGTTKEIQSTDEKDVLRQIVDALPRVEIIDPEKLKNIRNKLRSGHTTPWVLYFSNKDDDRLLLHQMRIEYSDMNFGEIDCSDWVELCASLQVEECPAWGALKAGGGYQRAPLAPLAPLAPDTVRDFIRTATRATRLHTLSASDMHRILDGDVGTWVLLVVPHQVQWGHVAEHFTKASLHFLDNDDISFGIMSCTVSTEQYCRQLARDSPAVLVHKSGNKHAYHGDIDEGGLVQFIQLIVDTGDMELSEQQMLDVMDPSGREHTWVVAFLPGAPHCGRLCDQLLHQWRILAAKLRPLEFVRVGLLQCKSGARGLCSNVRSPTARLYPLASGQHYSVSLQHLSEAPYMLEWALEHIDDSVQKLNWNSFSKNVVAEQLHPTRTKKPWLVYFHSPRCYRCYEMYADFAIAGILLNNAVELGKVNCITDRGLCQHEQITSYPSLRLYLGRNQHHSFSSVISIQVRDYNTLLQDIKPHLLKYDANLLAGIEELNVNQGFHIKHDEF